MKENFLNTFSKICFKTKKCKNLCCSGIQRVQNNKVKVITVISQERLLNRFKMLFAYDSPDSIVLLHAMCIACIKHLHQALPFEV